MSAYVTALEKVVTYEPKPEYWLDLTLRTIGKPGYSNRFDLDTYRLRKATGTLDKGSDYADATQLALQAGFPRSEEHTSELQSLMRISYAVFCLNKTKENTTELRTQHSRKYVVSC